MKQTHNYFAVLSPYDDDEEVEDVDEGKGKVIQKSPPPSPSTPPASGSPLTDKLPAELRLKMFELVLRSQYCLVNVGHLPRWKQGHLFSIAIFLVCRELFAEAEEVFYKVNTIRVKSLNDQYLTRDKIRYVEFAGDVAQRMFMWSTPNTNAGLNAAGKLPKLRTATTAVDCAYDLPQYYRRYTGPSFPATEAKRKRVAQFSRWLDYGVWELLLKKHIPGRHILKRYRLVDVVRYARAQDAEARAQGAEPSLRNVYDHYLQAGEKTVVRVNTLFAFWVAALEAMRSKLDGKTLDEDDQKVLEQSLDMTTHIRSQIKSFLKEMPKDVRLLDLKAGEHEPKLLEQADMIMGAIDLQP